jgi:hypothetical protein
MEFEFDDESGDPDFIDAELTPEQEARLDLSPTQWSKEFRATLTVKQRVLFDAAEVEWERWLADYDREFEAAVRRSWRRIDRPASHNRRPSRIRCARFRSQIRRTS